jgi:hypothetical protein
LIAGLVFACGDDEPAPASTLAPPTPAVTPLASADYEDRVGEEVWRRVTQAAWYDSGRVTQDGLVLLDAIVSGGALWRDEDSLALLDAFPEGIPQETWLTAVDYARMTLATPHEVILEPWLIDGVDEYERAVLDVVGQRVVSVVALRRALVEGIFREAFEASPESLNALQIDSIGSLPPSMLDVLRSEAWFNDGVDSYETSLLGILNSLLTVEEQLAILESGNYEPVELAGRSIAVVYLGDDHVLMTRAQDVIEGWMPKLEAFLGEFRPIGLVVDIKHVANTNFCHTNGISSFRPGRIALPQEFCYQSPVLVHELAHAFIGGRYPDWFAEGIAEAVSYAMTGSRSGYRDGSGTIQLESNSSTLSRQYYNQAAVGADFLEALYELAGEEQMSAMIQDVSGRSMTGAALLGRIREMNADTVALEGLITTYFGANAAGR